jgi:membrane protein
MKKLWQLLHQTISVSLQDKVPRLGASLAFYTALSIAPLLVIALGIAGYVFGDQAARGEISRQLDLLIGEQGGKAIQDMIASARQPSTGTVATALSLATLIFGASGVFGEIQASLNTIWGVQPKPGRGVVRFIRDRFLSFAMVMGIIFLLLVSLVVSTVLATIGTLVKDFPMSIVWSAHATNLVVSFAVITLLFAMMFKLLPDVEMAWKDVWLGAATTALLFTIGKFAIGMYLGHSGMASSYGVAGSFVVLLVWVYYSAQILYLGAELTKVYANHYGSKIMPSANAELIPEQLAVDKNIPQGGARSA